MNYSINVSKKGMFYFEVNRLSDIAGGNINEFVGKLRDDYPDSEGYLVEVSQVMHTRQTLDI